MTPFLVIGLCGAVVLLLSLVLGDLFDIEALAGDWFSTAALGGFVSALGFGGATAQAFGLGQLSSSLVGVAAGLVVGWFAAWLTRLVKTGGTDATPGARDAVGWDATVVTAIPESGYGAITVRRGGHVLRYNAQADRALPAGTAVHVTGVLSPTAVTVAATYDELT
ncbi:NfeD family protein [Nocardioides sp. CPCC 205120]|uniref:NfeD family protein n=1 Tax=Nocardioides sp. CPCC 205120 TaxID=3406462 RepID=UPI003B5089B6